MPFSILTIKLQETCYIVNCFPWIVSTNLGAFTYESVREIISLFSGKNIRKGLLFTGIAILSFRKIVRDQFTRRLRIFPENNLLV